MDNEYNLRETVRDMREKAGEDPVLNRFVDTWEDKIPQSLDTATVYAQYLKERESDKYSIMTNFSPWDDIVGPLRKGNLYVMAGYAGCGKTTLAAQLTVNLAKQGVRPYFFCMELTAPETFEVFTAHISSTVSPASEQYYFAAEQLQKWGVRFFDPSVSRAWKDHIASIESEVKRLDVGFLVVDNFHYLTRAERNQYEVESVASKTLKEMSQRLKIPVLLLHHLRKPEGDSAEPEPTVHALKGAGALVADASAVVILHHPLVTDPENEIADRMPVGYLRCSKSRWMRGGRRYVRLMAEQKRYASAGWDEFHPGSGEPRRRRRTGA